MLKKIATIVGARPQFIKAAAISQAVRRSNELREIMIHTGQHYDAKLSSNFFTDLDIPSPCYNLGVGSGGHGPQTGEIMKRLEPLLLEQRPNVVMVYGDTNSTLAGAITASKLHIPVAHVEAGLRSFDRTMPEEINRVVSDHVSTLLFCPTTTAVRNLAAEGITEHVFHTGDVMYDLALHFSSRAAQRSTILEDLKLTESAYVLATIHRAANTDDRKRLSAIFSAFTELAREISVVVALHPRTRKMLRQFDILHRLDGIKVTGPLGFLDMLVLIRNARVVATDSGGIQKEAYFHRVPCVTLRDQTEWIETIRTGWNVLTKSDSTNAIIETIRQSMESCHPRSDIDEYGDGCAASRITDAILRFLDASDK